MKFSCPKCGKEVTSVAKKNPPPCPLSKRGEFEVDGMLVKRHILCNCDTQLGEEVFSSEDQNEIGWWSISQQFLIDDDYGNDWIDTVRSASSSFVLRVSSLLSRLQKVE